MKIFTYNLLQVLATIFSINTSDLSMLSCYQLGPGNNVHCLHYLIKLLTGLPASSLALQYLCSANSQSDTVVIAPSGSPSPHDCDLISYYSTVALVPSLLPQKCPALWASRLLHWPFLCFGIALHKCPQNLLIYCLLLCWNISLWARTSLIHPL